MAIRLDEAKRTLPRASTTKPAGGFGSGKELFCPTGRLLVLGTTSTRGSREAGFSELFLLPPALFFTEPSCCCRCLAARQDGSRKDDNSPPSPLRARIENAVGDWKRDDAAAAAVARRLLRRERETEGRAHQEQDAPETSILVRPAVTPPQMAGACETADRRRRQLFPAE